MATYFKANGEVLKIKPAKGQEFTLEIRAYIGGYFEAGARRAWMEVLTRWTTTTAMQAGDLVLVNAH